MSDVGANIEDFSLRYHGRKAGFLREGKRPRSIISIRRQEDEDDDDYALRLNKAFDLEIRRRHRNGGRNIKELSEQNKDFLKGYNLAQKKKLVFGAGRDFDDSLFDQDLTGAFKAFRKLSEYFEMGGDPSLHRDVFLNLKHMTTVGCPLKNPALDEELPYKVFFYSSIHMLITKLPKGLGLVEAVHEVLNLREKKGLVAPGLDSGLWSNIFFNFPKTPFMNSKSAFMRNYIFSHRVIPDVRSSIPDILDWADPIETLDFVIERNSPLLTMAVRSAVDKIDRWYSSERTKDRQDDADDFISRRFAKMANPESGMSFAGVVRQKLSTAIENNHPQSEFLKFNLNKIEEVRARQEKELADRRRFAEQEIESLRAEQQERERKFQSGWGLSS